MGVYIKQQGAWHEIAPESGGMAWAKVSGGTVTTVTNPDGSVDEVHTFTANGTLTVDEPGYARVLLVGGGGAASSLPGGGGDIIDGIRTLPAGVHAVTVGAGGAFGGGVPTYLGRPSSVGTLTTAVSAMQSGKGGTVADWKLGYSSDISGTAEVYAKGSSPVRVNRGDGSDGGGDGYGSSGIVIVRVQKSAPTVSGVAATGGTVTEYTGDGVNGVAGQKYRVHKFTADGSLTVSQGGQADVLIAGGGGAAWSGSSPGQPGGVATFRTILGAGSLPVTIGAGGSGANGHGGTTTAGGWKQPGGMGGALIGGGTQAFSLPSSITGTSVTYGGQTTGNGTPTNTGAGGASPSGGWAGSAGVVIVRYEID